ncbi:MAG: polysaccharide deacetylase family protein [Tissierellia bacterium]|nr:polysaccharide deacetylase family protein [Tissierellia bacterium]
MKRRVIFLLALIILISNGVLAKDDKIIREEFLCNLLGKGSDSKEKITVRKLASILVDEIEITYDNYSYYRSFINDASDLSILKLYSEGILKTDEKGNIYPDKELTEKEVNEILKRIDEPEIPPRPTYEERKNIPILMYHEIKDLPDPNLSGLYVSEENFIMQLDALKAKGYNAVTMEEVYNHWINKAPLPENPIVLTFDDGYASHYSFVSKELNKRGMTGTFYIITWNVGKDPIRTRERLKEMYEEGMEIGSHTITHIDARYSPNETILKQYKESKEFLEGVIGNKVEHFCYPIGAVTEYARKVLKDLGYKTAVRTSYGRANPSQGLYDLKRIRIDYFDTVDDFLNKIEGEYVKTNMSQKQIKKSNIQGHIMNNIKKDKAKGYSIAAY